MRNTAFLPISIIASVLGGILARKTFEHAWSLIDSEGPPDPKQRDASWAKVIVGLALEGAIIAVVRGAIDRASRAGYLRVAGTWPGDDQPERQ